MKWVLWFFVALLALALTAAAVLVAKGKLLAKWTGIGVPAGLRDDAPNRTAAESAAAQPSAKRDEDPDLGDLLKTAGRSAIESAADAALDELFN